MAVEYASGSIHFSGLGSDTDFDDMIGKLAKIEQRQAAQLLRWKNDWQTRLDAFQQVRKEVLNLQTTLNSMNSINKFLVKAGSSSKEEVAKATPGATAVEGVYQVHVEQLATNSTWSKNTGLYNKTDTIAPNAGSITYTYKGKERTVSIPAGTTVQGMMNLINGDSKNPGVKAQLIQSDSGLVFQLRGMDTGKEASLVINSTTNINGLAAAPTSKYITSDGRTVLDKEMLLTDSVNTTTSPQTFVFTIDGNNRSVTVAAGTTLQQLITQINTEHPSYTSPDPALPPFAGCVASNGKYKFALERADGVYSYDSNNAGTEPTAKGLIDDGDPLTPPIAGAPSTTHIVNTGGDINSRIYINTKTTPTILDGTGAAIASTETATPIDFVIPANATIAQVASAIDAKLQFNGYGSASVWLDPADSTYKVKIEAGSKDHTVMASDAGTLEDLKYTPPNDPNWVIGHGQNAKIRINGWPATGYLETKSNNVSDVIEGMSFSLFSTGDTVITVNIDEKKITENVEKFVNGINSLRLVLKSLTDVSKEKKVLDPDYAESQFEMQKGSVLTGNYGIQLLSSRLKQTIAGSGIGFNYLQNEGNGLFSGDIFTSLSQIGITTDAEQGNTTYGLLIMNESNGLKGSLSFSEALKRDPEGIARLFSVKDEGKSQSPYFNYKSHIPGITKPGSYDVKYSINSSGLIDQNSIYINGEKGKLSGPNEISLESNSKNPAAGMLIDVYDLTPNGSFEGTVSIQSGKVNELLDMMSGSEGLLGSKGTLRILEDNYQKIMDGIDVKIKREDERLIKWTRTTRLKFSRLEEVLSKYNSINTGLKSQIAGLNGGKS